MNKSRIFILNGPGLPDLSNDEGHGYEGMALPQLRHECQSLCEKLGLSPDFRQTSDENKIFHWITDDSDCYDGLIINPASDEYASPTTFEMYGGAIRPVAHLKKPIVEVHIRNIFKPGSERTTPLYAPEGELGFVSGLGSHSYLITIQGHTSTPGGCLNPSSLFPNFY